MLNQTPTNHRPAPNRRRYTTAQCVIVGIAIEVMSLPVAAVLAFWGLIEYSGCFIECETSSSHPAVALLAFVAAAMIAPAGLWVGWLMSRRRTL